MKPSSDLALAIDAAKCGGKVVAEGFGNVTEIAEKGDKGVVTDIDKASEAAIISLLTKHSRYSVLAEESGRTGNSESYWVIDPLDGTTNFSRGIPLFGVNIALVKNNDIVIAATYDPVQRLCYWAEKGSGAFKDGKPIRVSEKDTLRESVIIVSAGYDAESRNRIGQCVSRLNASSTIRKLGTSAIELCHIASGHADAFVNGGDELWDYGPGLLLVKEAGGMVTDWRGKDLTIQENYLIASNGKLHKLISEQIAELQI